MTNMSKTSDVETIAAPTCGRVDNCVSGSRETPGLRAGGARYVVALGRRDPWRDFWRDQPSVQRRLHPTLSHGRALASFALALYLVSRVMRTLPVSVAYPVWAGVGTAGVTLIGVLELGESLGALKGLGVVLVVAGVVILNIASEKRSGC